ncbi:hypothetical protein SAMN05443551_2427 [Marivita hallyeonensis]|uniref:Uncharacterized protein n=1 Tax=Marivita hallyeonensis TaxID=996342 RepID=A0A1M5U0I2_9RHOB|nr:hypothetical protein SAMN05443551_2427 [Marivita hallyeonensis]
MSYGTAFPRGVRVALVLCCSGFAIILTGHHLGSPLLIFFGLTLFVSAIVGLQIPRLLLFFGLWVPAMTTAALSLLSWMEMDRD